MNRFQLAWTSLRSSLWFVPSVIVAASVAMAVLLIELDPLLGQQAQQRFPRLFGAGAEGTRAMLTAIASAMITVAGVVFSVTVVVLSLTSSQYSSRVLRNFMSDHANQTVLGAFVGIYAYCLIVLRTIRSGEEDGFVPSLAALGGIVLAFAGIGLLIHFIHHISSSIQASRILAGIHRASLDAIERLFPEPLGEGDEAVDEPSVAPTAWRTLTASGTGYVQGIAADRLLELAVAHDVVVRLSKCVGDFVTDGVALLEVAGEGELPEPVGRALCGAVRIGEERTVEQDVRFGLGQAVDVALKALSPGVNDPTTAKMAIDYLGALLAALASRRSPSPHSLHEGRLRVIAAAPVFATLLSAAIEPVRLAARGQPPVLATLIDAMGLVADAAGNADRRATVIRELERISRSLDDIDDVEWRNALAVRLECARRTGGRSRKAVSLD